MLGKYAEEFEVYYYTSDGRRMQEVVPQGVTHKVSRLATDIYGLRHGVFYVYLLMQAFSWRRPNVGLIRLLGVSLPVVPLLKLISRRKVVISFHYDWARQTQKNYRRMFKVYASSCIQRWSLSAADHVICTMGWLEKVAREEYGKTETTVIPNFVDLRRFHPRLPKKKRVVFVGRLHWSKGVDLLITAFRAFEEHHPDYSLTILGDGEERDRLEGLAAGSSRIVFRGSVPISEVAELLNESEIFVLPTKTMEGHARALVEAMAAGCKCIASNVAGNREVLMESSSEELMFEAGDAADLLVRLNRTQSYSSMNQLQFARQHYAMDVLFARESNIISDVLKDSGEGRSNQSARVGAVLSREG